MLKESYPAIYAPANLTWRLALGDPRNRPWRLTVDRRTAFEGPESEFTADDWLRARILPKTCPSLSGRTSNRPFWPQAKINPRKRPEEKVRLVRSPRMHIRMGYSQEQHHVALRLDPT